MSQIESKGNPSVTRVMEDLNTLEEDVVKIMDLAKGALAFTMTLKLSGLFQNFILKSFPNYPLTGTIRELQNAPACDVTELSVLATAYVDLVRSVHERISDCHSTVSAENVIAGHRSSGGDLLVKKSDEITQILAGLRK
jgi:hypothetical protein